MSAALIFGLWTIVCLVVFNLRFVDHSLSLRLQSLVCGPLFVSSSLILGLWTIVCLFVFNLWFVDHSLSLRL